MGENNKNYDLLVQKTEEYDQKNRLKDEFYLPKSKGKF